jgi:hypothetical protein
LWRETVARLAASRRQADGLPTYRPRRIVAILEVTPDQLPKDDDEP